MKAIDLREIEEFLPQPIRDQIPHYQTCNDGSCEKCPLIDKYIECVWQVHNDIKAIIWK